MSDRLKGPFAPVLDQYTRLEPDGTDTWNPLHSDRELLHRLAVYEQLCLALRQRRDESDRLRILDVGCGNGRSTRAYLDFGIRPDQLTGIDLRPAAIEMAHRRHAGIRFLAYDGDRLPFETVSFDWVSVCTVMSSISGDEARRHLAAEIVRILAPGGSVFYWDRTSAQVFAGGDRLTPGRWFSSLSVVSDVPVRIEGALDRHFPAPLLRRILLPLIERLATPRTHRACLLRKAQR